MLKVKPLMMRTLVLAALALASLGSGGFAAAEDMRPSQLACDDRKIGGRDLADCLRSAADHADRQLAAAVEAANKSIEARQGLLSPQKARWRRSLTESQALWINWRDEECQDVAPFEAGMAAKGGDPRLSCIIDTDSQRAASLKARYP